MLDLLYYALKYAPKGYLPVAYLTEIPNRDTMDENGKWDITKEDVFFLYVNDYNKLIEETSFVFCEKDDGFLEKETNFQFVGFGSYKNVQNPKDMFERLALFINSPWSIDEDEITIKTKETKTFSHKFYGEFVSVAEKDVVGYECLGAKLWGYGETPEVALNRMTCFYNWLECHFNKDLESI